MKFSRSKDGIDRTTVIVRIRLDREDVAAAKKIAAASATWNGDWRHMIDVEASSAVHDRLRETLEEGE